MCSLALPCFCLKSLPRQSGTGGGLTVLHRTSHPKKPKQKTKTKQETNKQKTTRKKRKQTNKNKQTTTTTKNPQNKQEQHKTQQQTKQTKAVSTRDFDLIDFEVCEERLSFDGYTAVFLGVYRSPPSRQNKLSNAMF